MKKCLIIPFLMIAVSATAQQDIVMPRTTHLLDEPNQATFDHNRIVPAGTELFVMAYKSDYYLVRHNQQDYYIFYPYFSSIEGISEIKKGLVESTDIEHNGSVKPNSSTPTRQVQYQPSPSRTIHTGPRGGRYYINKNGNKTYIKH